MNSSIMKVGPQCIIGWTTTSSNPKDNAPFFHLLSMTNCKKRFKLVDGVVQRHAINLRKEPKKTPFV